MPGITFNLIFILCMFRFDENLLFNFKIKRTKEIVGMNVALQPATISDSFVSNGSRKMLQGFIAALKDGFGFIETKEHDKEIFFQFR